MRLRIIPVFLLKGCAVIISILLVSEGWLRVLERSSATQEMISQRRYTQEVSNRIYSSWLSTKPRQDPFTPPFLVYANSGIADPERMRDIFETTRLPASHTWTSDDFLQDKKRAAFTKYVVHSNSLGFRNKEYTKEKPPGVYRVIVLGSYDSFGHGVDDDETYAARLEAKLNEDLPGTFEVWNGGRHASTAIVGLARMQYEIFDYNPDLLVFDYGSLDQDIVGDNIFPKAMRFPDSPLFISFRNVLGPLVPVWGNSLLWLRFGRKYLREQTPVRSEQFTEVMNVMLSLSEVHHVPTVVIKQLGASSGTYQGLTTGEPFFLDIQSVFAKSMLTYPPIQEWKTGYWTSTWLAELENPEWLLRAAADENRVMNMTRFKYYPYYRSFLRFNSKGQEVIGLALAELIEKEVLKFPLSR